MDLVIAEKHSAAKTLANILGKPKKVNKGRVKCYELQDMVLVPLRGHIKNPDFPDDYNSWRATDLEELIDAPIQYQETRKSIGNTIRHYAKKVDELTIATDYDREGESIGKEAIQITKEKNPDIPIKRARFSSLTSKEVKDAFSNLKGFDWNLANSADARREIDLIWGATLTRYISLAGNRLGKSFLSVGRVQTPTLAEIVDREKERKDFTPKPYWKPWIKCQKNNQKFKANYKKKKVFKKKKAKELKELGPGEAEVKKVKTTTYTRKPPTPFNTTKFLRQASSIGYSPSTALSIAESLYQDGIISYPRTDNTQYPDSLDLKDILKKLKKIDRYKDYSEKLLKKKLKPTKGKKKSTDHPPIHPVKKPHKELNKSEWRIYQLIADRFIATLSEKSKVKTIKSKIDYEEHEYRTKGRKIIKPGWQSIYPYKKTKEIETPKLKEGEQIKVEKTGAKKKKTKPRPRYSSNKIIKYMSDNDLGTKSTRPSILDKLTSRNYITNEKGYKPTKIAFPVINALEKHAGEITKPKMTAKLKKEIDQVKEGKKEKDKVVKDSRKMLKKVLKQLEENKDEVSEELRKALKKEERMGKCTKKNCDGQLTKRRSRKGSRFVGCTNYPKCTNTYPLPQSGSIEPLGEKCEECGSPRIKVSKNRGRDYEMCLDPDCSTKESWNNSNED